MQERDDATLLAAIADRKDQEAFELLFKRYKRAMYNLAVHMTRSHTEAEEVLQESMITIWTGASRFNETGSARSWLLKIVALRCLKRMEAKKPSNESVRFKVRLDSDLKSPSPQENAKRLRECGAIRKQLSQLPYLDRQLLILFYGGGLSSGEVAESLNVQEDTIPTLIQHAFEQLRINLTQHGFSDAIHLVSEEGLTEALSSEPPLPPGVQERLFKKIFRAASESVRRTFSRNTDSGLKFSWIRMAMFIVALMFLGASIWFFIKSRNKSGDPKDNLRTPPAQGYSNNSTQLSTAVE